MEGQRRESLPAFAGRDEGYTKPVWIPEHKRFFSKTGKTVIQSGYWYRRKLGEQPFPEDAWVKGAPIRSIGHLIAAFRADVQERLGADAPSPELIEYWWSAVEETEWREMVQNLRWLDQFAQPLIRSLLGRHRHGRSRPPMVRRIERERAKGGVPSARSLEFKRYHMMRPDVYVRFRQLAEQKLQAGHAQYSAMGLLEELRATGVSITMGYSSDYARKLIAEDERFATFFRLGHRKHTVRDKEEEEQAD